jgi:signal transduction histidine kinase
MFFPVYNWHIAIRFEYAVIFSAFAFLGLFLQNLFPGRISKKIIWPSVGLLCCYLAIITFAAPAFFSSLVVYYQILCTLMVFYSILMLAGGLRGSGGSIPESLAFFGLLPFAALVINDALALNNLPNLGNNNLMPEGIVVFMFAYMLILASEFAENERALLAVRQQEEKITAENFTLERLNRIKTEFLSNISHELKTPLTIMSSYAQLSKIQINMGEAERGEISGNLQVITSEAEHLALMVGQLLDVSRVEEGRSKLEKTPASVGEIVKNVVDTYFPALNKNNNRLELDVADDLPLVYADARKIGQVLVNLISNAVKNTRDGIITILAEFSGDDLESAEKDFVKITVSDTGVGIDESLMPHIFERYATGGAKNSGGTGLGLYVSQSFVEGHGGRIWAENNPGAGTRVCFTLPVYISSNDENMKQ